MSGDPYSARVRDYFANPRHVGDLADAAIGYFADQGLSLKLAATVADGRILKLRFKAHGCPHVIAATESICRHFEGRDADDLDAFDGGQLMRELAVPVEKSGRILVLEDTVRSLAAAIRDRAAQ